MVGFILTLFTLLYICDAKKRKIYVGQIVVDLEKLSKKIPQLNYTLISSCKLYAALTIITHISTTRLECTDWTNQCSIFEFLRAFSTLINYFISSHAYLSQVKSKMKCLET